MRLGAVCCPCANRCIRFLRALRVCSGSASRACHDGRAAGVELDPVSKASPPPRGTPTLLTSVERTRDRPPPTERDENGCRIPVDMKSWDLVAVLQPSSVKSPTLSPRILTWLIEVDDNGQVTDRVILLLHQSGQRGADRWELAHYLRHPLDRDDAWQVSMVYDEPYVGRRSFSSSPGQSEMEAFLRDTWWTFEPAEGFLFLDAEICADAWISSIGSPPNHAYP